LPQNNPFAESDFQIGSALHDFHQGFRWYFREANLTGVVSQARKVLAKFDNTEIIRL
jgi:hypothetical protein